MTTIELSSISISAPILAGLIGKAVNLHVRVASLEQKFQAEDDIKDRLTTLERDMRSIAADVAFIRGSISK